MSGDYAYIKQNQYMRVFRKAEVTDRSRARTLSDLGLRETHIFRRMVDRGVFVETGAGTYYMDADAADEFIAARRKRVFLLIVLELIILLILWAFGGKLFR